jgi:hypothetical protein
MIALDLMGDIANSFVGLTAVSFLGSLNYSNPPKCGRLHGAETQTSSSSGVDQDETPIGFFEGLCCHRA